MSLKEVDVSARGTLDQLAGLTGLGWTTSMLSFLTTVIHSGNSPVGRLVPDSQLLLYLGVAFFVTTLLLDRLIARRSSRGESTGTPVSGDRLSRDDAPTRPAHGPSVTSSQIQRHSCIPGPSFS